MHFLHAYCGLSVAENADNSQDMARKGRWRNQNQNKTRCIRNHELDGIDHRGDRYCKHVKLIISANRERYEMEKLYVNVYAVTRHYGGPEEQGWWYNRGQVLASSPVPAKSDIGHKRGICNQCDAARNKGLPSEMCHDEPSDEFVESAVQDIISLTEQRQEPVNEEEIREKYLSSNLYKEQCKPVTHLLPLDEKELSDMVERMHKCFDDEKEGDIYSVLGGVDIQINVDEHPAANWPATRPHYE
jgi:hypothetical protein